MTPFDQDAVSEDLQTPEGHAALLAWAQQRGLLPHAETLLRWVQEREAELDRREAELDRRQVRALASMASTMRDEYQHLAEEHAVLNEGWATLQASIEEIARLTPTPGRPTRTTVAGPVRTEFLATMDAACTAVNKDLGGLASPTLELVGQLRCS